MPPPLSSRLSPTLLYIAMDDLRSIFWTLAVSFTAYILMRRRFDPLRSIPTVGGPSVPGIFYPNLAALNFVRNAKELLTIGHEKYRGAAFKVAFMGRWIVVVSDSKHLDEIKSHPELSIAEGLDEFLQLKHTIGATAQSDRFHVNAIRDQLTRSLNVVMPAVAEELALAIPEYIPCTGDGPWISGARRSIQQTVRILKPIFYERKTKLQEYGADWTDRPSLTHALYDLATHPGFIQPLRDEIESVIAADGWTKRGMNNLWKLDSFLRESQRVNGLFLISLARKAMKDVTLHDGTFLPKGTFIVADQCTVHNDDNNYEHADQFDPFRFARMREVPGEDLKHQLVTTSREYLPFGHGKHACPGRFFASMELKAVMSYLLVNYDIALDGSLRPENQYFGIDISPDPSGRVLFRRREPRGP
ncbi:cytochrome P450 [Dichomitus squalens]|uniref:Cytochrome P450 n=1 Tax=Dichomitus squalens TaxID=114155 RepID=A0A4Q9Q442_9APHY|nr:cytochrome P450 [Dichomitus squalens]TBU42429.1 cytochrome P450 [Dichomitus squalens]TBU61384.1 cytochrome P450 [Dichomitus squalens]